MKNFHFLIFDDYFCNFEGEYDNEFFLLSLNDCEHLLRIQFSLIKVLMVIIDDNES